MKKVKSISKIFRLIFILLVIFDFKILLTDSKTEMHFIKNLLGKEATPGEGNGGGTTQKPTYFANFGTRTEMKYCQKTTISSTGGISIEYYFAEVYWLQEYCVYGGNMIECTYGTGRRTFQGGGC